MRSSAVLLISGLHLCFAVATMAATEPIPPPAEMTAIRPLHLVDDPETIYAPLAPPKPNSGVNQGGVNFNLSVNYLTDYVYRGIDRTEPGAINPLEGGRHPSEDAPNLQFDGKLSFDLGRMPHPFVGVFVNVFNDDPISRFQEVRPYAGLDWKLRPLQITAGWQAYIFPERDDFNTSEIFLRVELDDSVLLHADRPLFSPYIYGAYDFDRYDGFYIEAGVKHDFQIGESGITLTLLADVGYVYGNGSFTARAGDDIGFQHYEFGAIGTYPLNTLLNISRRYGEWKLRGYLFYTDGIENNLRADTGFWGGVGISFEY
jgi:hypothetical protein